MTLDPDATAPAAARGVAGPTRDTRWAGYEVREPLGEGGMGVVFAAHDPELDREVALKVLHDEGLGLAGQERLRREARALARVAHPNVVPVYEVGEHGGRTYYTMERVRGRSVKEWAREPRAWRDVQRVFLDAARGLAAIHAAGLVHRDVKPGNILLGDDGRARIADLGIAAAGAGAPGGFHDSTTMRHAGTPAYMAPEQLGGAAGDARADQFALGVSLFEALHGCSPFPGDSLAMRLAGFEDGPRPPVRDVPRWLDAVCRRALAIDPDDRFVDLTTLIAALEGPRPSRWPIVAVAGLVLATAGTIGVVLLRAGDHPIEDACASAGSALPAWDAIPGEAGAQLERIGTRWQVVAHAVCLRGRDRSWTVDASARAGQCLTRRRAELTAAAAAFASPQPEDDEATTGLIAPELCFDDAYLGAQAEPLEDLGSMVLYDVASGHISRALARLQAGDIDGAEAMLAAASPTVTSIDYAPLLGEAERLRAQIARYRGDYRGAAAILENLYYTLRARGADGDALGTAASIAELATTELADDALADHWLRIGLADAARRPTSREAADVYFTAAARGYMTGDLAGAEVHARRGLAIAKHVYGDDGLDGARWYEMLGVLLDTSGRPSEAIPYYERAIGRFTAWYGPESPVLAGRLQNLALAESALGRFDDAIAHTRRAAELLARWPDALPRDRGEALLNLGAILLQAHRPAEAIAPLTESADSLRRALGEPHPDVALAMANLAAARSRVAIAAGDRTAVTAVVEELRDALEATRTAGGPDHPETLIAEVNLADALIFLDDCAGAAPLATHALGAGTAAGNLPGSAFALEVLGRCAMLRGDGRTAVGYLQRAADARATDADPILRAQSAKLLEAAKEMAR